MTTTVDRHGDVGVGYTAMRLTEQLRQLFTRQDDMQDVPEGVRPPSRELSADDPLTLSVVFRAVQILQTAVSGMPLHEYRYGQRLDNLSPLVAQPDVNRSRRDWIADIVMSLAVDGNAFVRLIRDSQGAVISCPVIAPHLVTVRQTNQSIENPHIVYTINGRDYTGDDIVHCKFVNQPGQLRGLGPVQQAAIELKAAQMARDAKTAYYMDGSNIKGYLHTTQPISRESAQVAKDLWKQGQAGDVPVLGNGIDYKQSNIKAEEWQYLGPLKFETTQIARLFGIPASLMLAAVDGSNLTYSNIEQSRIEFADYTLSAYAGEIEEVFNRILPRGREAHFDLDSARYSTTSDRYNAYKTAIEAGWLTVDEVRAREGLPALNQERQTDESQ